MTYNYFNELKRSFEKRAFTYSDGEEKEASYLGRRAMEKSGQRAVSKWLKNVGEQGGKWVGPSAAPYARGNILPTIAAGGAGYAGYEAGGDSLTVGGLTGLGTLGLFHPRVLKQFQESALSRARKKGDWPKGMTPQQAYDTGLTELTPQQHRNSMWTNEFLKGLGLKGALVTGGVALEHGPGMVQDVHGFTSSGRGFAENLEKQTAAPTMYTISNGQGFNEEQPQTYINRLVAEIAGDDKADPIAEGEDAAYDKFANKWRSFFKKELPKPAAERNLSFSKKPQIAEAITDAAGEFQDVTSSTAEFTGEVLPKLKNVLDPLPETARTMSEGMRSQAEEAGRWREGVGTAINKAAPVGAGALGGYILSSLLGPRVKQDETPSERERRERLQRIYNLVATTGGGALGYYLSNRLGGGDDTKTASALGRAAAQQFSY